MMHRSYRLMMTMMMMTTTMTTTTMLSLSSSSRNTIGCSSPQITIYTGAVPITKALDYKLKCVTGVQLEMQILAPTFQRFSQSGPRNLPFYQMSQVILMKVGPCLHSKVQGIILATLKPKIQWRPGTQPQGVLPATRTGLCSFPLPSSHQEHLGPGGQQRPCLNPENQ